MSVRTELEDLAKWISDLSAGAGSPQRGNKRNWEGASNALKEAAKDFLAIASGLKAHEPHLAEFARDLERQARDLALRADLLSKGAPAGEDGEESAPADEEGAERAPAGKDAEESTTMQAESSHDLGVLLDSAATELGTAHERLFESVSNPGGLMKNFEKELDVVIEMSLSLRLEYEASNQRGSGAQEPSLIGATASPDPEAVREERAASAEDRTAAAKS